MKTLFKPFALGMLSLALSGPLLAVDTPADLARRVEYSSVFRSPIRYLGADVPAAADSEAVLASFKAFDGGAEAGKAALEAFLASRPDSKWAPSIAAHLAENYRESGRYSKALKLWSSAWAKCKTGTDDNSKRVAGDVMAQWTRLLASLGRLEELDAIYTDAAKTGADLGSLKPLIDQTKEGVARMASKPGIAYRCGTYALYNVGKALQPTNPALEALNNIDSPLAGFSMGELVDFARSNNIPVKAVRLRAQDPLPVPSVVHWSENHYAAIVAGTNGMYKVIDPTFRETKWISEAAIREETSGRLLVPVNSATASMEALAAADLKNTRGKGHPNDIDDGDDGDDSCDDNPDGSDPALPGKDSDTSGSSSSASPIAKSKGMQQGTSPVQKPLTCPPDEEPPQPECGSQDNDEEGCGCNGNDIGMPVWRVSQPYQTLWLSDTPLFYYNSVGEIVRFRLTYKHRSTETASGLVTGFGDKWTCNWISAFRETPTTLNPAISSGDKVIQQFRVGGGVVNMNMLSSSRHPKYATSFQDFSSQQKDGKATVGKYLIRYPRGGTNAFNYPVSYGADNADVYLNKRIDRVGRMTTINWAKTTLNGSDFHRIQSITDIDGRSMTLEYKNAAFPNQVTKVSDPYGRSAEFVYDSLGRLWQIKDMMGMVTTFTYGAGNFIQKMETPYGPTTFNVFNRVAPNPANAVKPLGTVGVAGYDRALIVTPPNGAREMFAYADLTLETSSSGGGGDRGSYHWSPKQYDLLPAAWKAAVLPDPSTLQPADYFKGGLRTYLRKSAASPSGRGLISDTVIHKHGPVPAGKMERANYRKNDYPGSTATIEGSSSFSSGKQKKRGGRTYLVSGISRNSWGHILSMDVQRNVSDSLSDDYRTWKYDYDSEGQRMLHRYGPKLQPTDATAPVLATYAYNPTNPFLLTSIKDANNEETVVEYDLTLTKVKSIRYPGGKTYTFEYFPDGAYKGWLKSRTEVGVGTDTITGYKNGLPIGFTDRLNLTTTLEWDDLNRPTKITYPDTTTRVYTYDRLNLVSVKDRLNNTTQWQYNAAGQLRLFVDAAKRETSFYYCTCGSLETIKTPQGTTTLEYDEFGRNFRTTYPDNYVVTRTYTEDGMVQTASDSGGRSVAYTYDSMGKVLTKVLGGKNTPALSNEYDNFGRLFRSTELSKVVREYEYDLGGRIKSLTTRDSGASRVSKESFLYDGTGLTRYTDANQKSTGFVRDGNGRPLVVTDAKLQSTRFTYAADGQVLTMLDGANHKTSWEYDAYGLLRRKLNDLNTVVATYDYDAEGRLLRKWTPAVGTISYVPDSMGFVTSITYPRQGTVTYQPDAAGRLRTMTDAIGTTTFNYTAGDQFAGETGPWKDSAISIQYANRMRDTLSLAQPNAGPWVQGYKFDKVGRLDQITDRNGTYQYKYDLIGYSPSANPSSLVFPAGASGTSKIVYGYDELDRLNLSELDQPSGDLVNKHSYHYNDLAQRDQEYRYGSGANAAAVKLDYTYSDVGELQSSTATDVNGASPKARPHQSFGYTYDAGGNLKTRTANPGTKALVTTFFPDTLNQLKTSTRTGRLTVAGATAGNPGSVVVNGVQASLYSDGTFAVEGAALSDTGPTTFNVIAADARGRKDSTSVTVNQPASVSFTYDANGNLRSDGVRTLTYDDLDELSSVEIPGKTRTEFQYDGLRRLRIRKEYSWRLNRWVVASETRYVYDGMLVVEERNGQNVPLVSYTRGADLSKRLKSAGGIGGLLGRTDRTTGKVAYYHSDTGGNVTALINSDGIQVANYTYDPYGNLVAMNGPLAAANTYRFSSKEWIQSAGLAYFGYRFYDPNLQRWLNGDPMGENGGINLFGFVNNDPEGNIDAYGLEIVVDPKDRDDYNAARKYLGKDPVMDREIKILEKCKTKFTLKTNSSDDDSYEESTRTINWDPQSALLTTSGGKQSPAMGLGHECCHAAVRKHDRSPDPAYGNKEERRVIEGPETCACKTLNEDIRKDHGGKPYRVKGPTKK